MSAAAAGVISLGAWRERRAWAAAAEYLNGQGMAAAVPPELAPWLRARGLVVWERAA